MKSIVEEHSSVAKAVERAWVRAGKPQEFTVKVFEEPEYHFGIFTKKMAKVGIFFDHVKEQKVYEKRDVSKKSEHQDSIALAPFPKQPPKKDFTSKKAESSPKFNVSLHDEMKVALGEWVAQLLKKSDIPSVPFTVSTVSGNRIHIVFKEHLMHPVDQETALLRSLSYLLLGMLKSRFKKEFRYLKLILTVSE